MFEANKAFSPSEIIGWKQLFILPKGRPVLTRHMHILVRVSPDEKWRELGTINLMHIRLKGEMVSKYLIYCFCLGRKKGNEHVLKLNCRSSIIPGTSYAPSHSS